MLPARLRCFGSCTEDCRLQPVGVSMAGVLTAGVPTEGVLTAGVPARVVPTVGKLAAGEIILAGVLPPVGTPTGKISVLSSRFFLGFGSGAANTLSVGTPHPKVAQTTAGKLTLVVLLHVESAQQHDRLLAEEASVDGVRRIDALVHVHSHDAAGAAKAVVEAAKVHAADSELAQGRGAHDAGLDGHVEVGGVQDGRVVAGHDLAESDKLGVASALFCSISVDILRDWEGKERKGEKDRIFQYSRSNWHSCH
jgi:hypothetical protein